MYVLAMHNKGRTQRISNREFKLWTFLQWTKSRMATFHAETCVMSRQSIWAQKMTNCLSSSQFKTILCNFKVIENEFHIIRLYIMNEISTLKCKRVFKALIMKRVLRLPIKRNSSEFSMHLLLYCLRFIYIMETPPYLFSSINHQKM